MKVSELIDILNKLDQNKEIKYDSYEFVEDFDISDVKDSGNHYTIID